MVPQLLLLWWFSKLWPTKKWVIDKCFEKKNRLWTLVTFCYSKCMLPLQYLSDWCLHGVYFWQKIQRENISNWVIILIKFNALRVLWVLHSTLASSGPQLQRQFAYRCCLGASSPDCHLTLKTGHLQKREVPSKC